MERPIKSKIRHGMASCARYGCKRPECVSALKRARRESERDVRNGNRFIVPAANASKYANRLVIAGMSPKDIADRSGVSERVITEITQSKQERIYRTTEEAVLGIPIPEDGWTSTTDGFTNAVGTRRRLQALSFHGFPLSSLSSEINLPRKTIFSLRSGAQARVLISGMRAVLETHDRLWDVDPLSTGLRPHDVTRAQRWAMKRGWLPTEVWADMDDPDCAPVFKTPRYVALAEDAQELIDQQGYSRKDAATRLGVEPETLKWAIWYYRKVRAKETV